MPLPHEEQGTSAALFFCLFEITSAFGNVGLSLGSIKNKESKPCDFSQDLTPLSLVVVSAVALFGRTRDLPSTLDASLSLPKLDKTTRASLFAVPCGPPASYFASRARPRPQVGPEPRGSRRKKGDHTQR